MKEVFNPAHDINWPDKIRHKMFHQSSRQINRDIYNATADKMMSKLIFHSWIDLNYAFCHLND